MRQPVHNRCIEAIHSSHKGVRQSKGLGNPRTLDPRRGMDLPPWIVENKNHHHIMIIADIISIDRPGLVPQAQPLLAWSSYLPRPHGQRRRSWIRWEHNLQCLEDKEKKEEDDDYEPGNAKWLTDWSWTMGYSVNITDIHLDGWGWHIWYFNDLELCCFFLLWS